MRTTYYCVQYYSPPAQQAVFYDMQRGSQGGDSATKYSVVHVFWFPVCRVGFVGRPPLQSQP